MRVSLLHLNIRSLRSNLDDFHLRTEVKESKHSFNVICLIETRLMNLKQIQVTFFQITKEFIMKKLTKEGPFMYIRNDLTNKIRNYLCISDDNREIRISINHKKHGKCYTFLLL